MVASVDHGFWMMGPGAKYGEKDLVVRSARGDSMVGEGPGRRPAAWAARDDLVEEMFEVVGQMFGSGTKGRIAT